MGKNKYKLLVFFSFLTLLEPILFLWPCWLMTLVNNVSIQDKFSCCYYLAFSIIYTMLEYFLSVCMYVTIFLKKYSTYSNEPNIITSVVVRRRNYKYIFFENPRWPPKIQNGRQNITFLRFSQKVLDVRQWNNHHNIRCGQAKKLQVFVLVEIKDGRQNPKWPSRKSDFWDFRPMILRNLPKPVHGTGIHQLVYTILEYFLSVCMSVCTHFSQKVFNVQQKMKHHNIRCGQAEELQVNFFLKIQDGHQKSKMATKKSGFCDFLKKY